MNEEIRSLVRAQPFLPFDVQLVDGRVVHVEHHDFISVPPGNRSQYVIVYDKQGRFEVINTSLAIAVRLSSNGHGKRKKAG
ncbi:MAG TPA: hypothetical protein VHN77_04450 [Phycisphaerales bacterium]|nr:hypothetical protein [Phycisphaerales bacterium]